MDRMKTKINSYINSQPDLGTEGGRDVVYEEV